MPPLAVLASAYVLGSIPFGPIVAHQHGVDLRTVGSGNVGATNVGRALGARAGRLVLALDAAKGTAAVLLARALGAAPSLVALSAFAAVLGHCFSIFLRGRGGKGAATALGVTLALAPFAGFAGASAYVLAKRSTRVASVGSLAGLFAAFATGLVVEGASMTSGVLFAIALVVIARHAENLRRLRAGSELPA